jgi:Cu(I)-responsive transcriptional regulator
MIGNATRPGHADQTGAMTIGEAAAASSVSPKMIRVSPKMIRYYEAIGLVSPAPRRGSGYRLYGPENVAALRFVGRARELGFPVRTIAELLVLWRNPDRSNAEVRRVAQDHADALRRRLAELEGMVAALDHLVAECAGDGRPNCPIRDGLAGQRRRARWPTPRARDCRPPPDAGLASGQGWHCGWTVSNTILLQGDCHDEDECAYEAAKGSTASKVVVAASLCLAGLLPAAAHAVPFLQAPTFADEVQYLEFTIDHHYSALRMTELAAGTSTVGSTSDFAGAPDVFPATPAKATDPVALQVATMANAAQRREIVEGQGFLRTYYGINFIPTLEPPLQPLVSYLDAAAPGDPFNVAFLEDFSGHHATLVPASQECATAAPHADVQAYCASIVVSQTRQITQMRTELADVYGITSIPYETIPLPDNGAFPPAGTGGGTAVPEPASAALLAAGLLGLGLALRGRKPARTG